MVKPSEYLNGPASRADVIGWCLTVPLLAWFAVTAPVLYGLPAKYSDLFSNFDVSLPVGTAAFLSIGGPGLVLLFGLLVLVPVGVLAVSHRASLKVGSPLICGIAAVLLHYRLVVSLLEPVAQLAAQLPEQGK